MGNQTSVLKNQYIEQNYKTIFTHTDSNIGTYDLIKFHNISNSLYLKRTINPDDYDEYTCDWEEFQKKIYNTHINLCDF